MTHSFANLKQHSLVYDLSIIKEPFLEHSTLERCLVIPSNCFLNLTFLNTLLHDYLKCGETFCFKCQMLFVKNFFASFVHSCVTVGPCWPWVKYLKYFTHPNVIFELFYRLKTLAPSSDHSAENDFGCFAFEM